MTPILREFRRSGFSAQATRIGITHPNPNYSPLAQISQEPAEFELPRSRLPRCFHFTGPYHSAASRRAVAFPYERLSGRPLIYTNPRSLCTRSRFPKLPQYGNYVFWKECIRFSNWYYASMGTVQNRQQAIFDCIARACAGWDADVVISLGGSCRPQDLPELPGDPIVVEYAPQLALLDRAALAITHAGLNTTLEALARGVPLVAVPVANDQPGVGARIAWTGTGEVVPLKRLSAAKLKQAVGRVLQDPYYKENALGLQEAIRCAGGVISILVAYALDCDLQKSFNMGVMSFG